MESRLLRHFLAVAEELNFTRAAEWLGITQPLLSLTRGVELTDTGKVSVEESRTILRQVERAKTGAVRRGRGEIGQLNIGAAFVSYFHPLIPTIIREYRKLYSEVVLVPETIPETSGTTMLVARLGAGAMDTACVDPANVGPPNDGSANLTLPVHLENSGGDDATKLRFGRLSGAQPRGVGGFTPLDVRRRPRSY